jgi:hypothetical protein
MIDKSTLFKINSETDEQVLLDIYNTAAKRINALRAFKVLPKVEIIIEKKEAKVKELPEGDKDA